MANTAPTRIATNVTARKSDQTGFGVFPRLFDSDWRGLRQQHRTGHARQPCELIPADVETTKPP